MLILDVKRYADLHRSLGFKFRCQHGLLRSFANFATRRGETTVRSQTAIAWAAQAPSPPQRHNRLATVRRFALAMHAEDPRHEVPSDEVFGRQFFRRRTPYIYTPEQVTGLMDAAGKLPPKNSIRPATYSTLFGLLAATGLRVSEALALQIEDFTDDGLLVRKTKFKKSRLVLLHATTRRALERYLARRAKVGTPDHAFFISVAGTSPSYETVHEIFLSLSRSIGLRGARGNPGPTLHHLRHTFAARSLEGCDGSRESVSRHMVALTTYLGHAHVSDTYWYLESTPALLRHIARAGEALPRGGIS
jgi:integrase